MISKLVFFEIFLISCSSESEESEPEQSPKPQSDHEEDMIDIHPEGSDDVSINNIQNSISLTV